MTSYPLVTRRRQTDPQPLRAAAARTARPRPLASPTAQLAGSASSMPSTLPVSAAS